MTGTEDRVRLALDAWKGRGGDGRDEAVAAEALLASAEGALADGEPDGEDACRLWHEFLGATGTTDFLERLPDDAARRRWADTAFAAIRRSGYTLDTMLRQRVAAHPNRVLFSDARDASSSWSYAQVAWYARSIAGLLLEASPAPRVAIYAENSVDVACTDLACLLHGFLVSPLNIHFDAETLAWIIERLQIDVVVTDSEERLARVAGVLSGIRRDVAVFRAGSAGTTTVSVRGIEARGLRPACAQIDQAAAAARLSARRVDLTAPATVMFTSGSTGRPKGVVFTLFNLVTKRFARAAALASVGRDEVLLCYLPLFHTFGRFLEMLGTIYWGGTYVFAGGPTVEGLMADLARVRPTGLISVPVRWVQLREQCLERMEAATSPAEEAVAFREIVGDRLRWGLSAAGYLDPAVFRFFQRYGVDLCSGFGMTEATGGVTMTPPGRYVDGTVGTPLPGVRIRFGADGELQFAGVYAARYLDEDGPKGSVAAAGPDADHWIATGDLFLQHPGGYLEIVDRIKDIYKNSRGQTIAPQRVEQRLAAVPGIRRTFLAGDRRDYNVLLVVLDRDDPIVATRSDEEVREYVGQIVASVNEGLAPYERVVRFAVVDRDFDASRGEVTPKGSLRRKVIAEHFSDLIETLYRSNHVDLDVGGVPVRIPRWFFRDLAVLEYDIVVRGDGLFNTRSRASLRLVREADGFVRIGDLVYHAGHGGVDLGLFARQPRLWVGNPALVAFAPCKPGWELPLRELSDQVRLPRVRPRRICPPPAHLPGDERLREAHEAVLPALFGTEEEALAAIDRLQALLARADERVAGVVRRRLAALAFRPEEEVRARAYRVLLLDDPVAGYDQAFPAFVESGLTFLNKASIADIARMRHDERRLQSLRQRLSSYRERLAWPGPPVRRAQFARVLQMLADFARHDPESLPAVEAELATWALFRAEPRLARKAAMLLDGLTAWHEQVCLEQSAGETAEPPADRIVFDFAIPAPQRAAIRAVLHDRTFLRRALARAFGEEGFAWSRVADGGIWISPVVSRYLGLYRLAINLVDGKHFDLLLVTGQPLRHRKTVGDTILWMMALSNHAFGPSALPRFGSWRPDLGAAAIAYVSQLTAWERIRELTRVGEAGDRDTEAWLWRRLFVRAMSAFFRAWEQSGRRIVPGALTPSNVAVPDTDVHENATILSLAGWRPYAGPRAFVTLLFRNFFRQTEAYHPRSRDMLQAGWIFDACLEAFGAQSGGAFLDALAGELAGAGASGDAAVLARALDAYRVALEHRPHVPLPVDCAIHRYSAWAQANPGASPDAREEAVRQMIELYRLDRFGEVFRYHFYRHTYFARASAQVHEVFDRLVARRLGRATPHHGGLEELSELQDLMTDATDRAVFSRMVFPHASRTQALELLHVGQRDDGRVVVRSSISDNAGTLFEVREPVTPVEVGRLYQLALDADYPRSISAEDRHLAIVDRHDRVIGGLFYRWQESGDVYVDAIVVAEGFRHRGLAGRLLEDFCVRMEAQGAGCVKTHFFLGRLFTKHGFRVDQRRGGLVRFLHANPAWATIDATGFW